MRGKRPPRGTHSPAVRLPLQAPASTSYVTYTCEGHAGERKFPFASVALSTNPTTLPLLSEAKISSTSPEAKLGPYACAARPLIIRFDMQAWFEACTDPTILKFASTPRSIITLIVLVCAYDSIVPENEPCSDW